MTAPAPILQSRRDPLRRRLGGPAVSLLAGVTAVGVLAVRDPHQSGSYGRCPFLAVTGLPCPLCGGLRAVSDLAHGQLQAALLSNGLAVAMVVGGAMIWGAWVVRRARGTGAERPPLTSNPRFAQVVGLTMLVFCLVRWIPDLAALRPS